LTTTLQLGLGGSGPLTGSSKLAAIAQQVAAITAADGQDGGGGAAGRTKHQQPLAFSQGEGAGQAGGSPAAAGLSSPVGDPIIARLLSLLRAAGVGML
jgi:hypothetical protein